tara:strand:+ start:2036 stop:2605 length:570 start_codon:yes stop_codon:yes gene_type:complete
MIMRAKVLPLLMVLVFMTVSLSGCMGLIQARESLEGMRGEPVDKPYADKIGMAHTFQTESLVELFEEYSNSTSFTIDESVQRIEIYFKVTISGSDNIACIEQAPARYVRPTVTTASGAVLWSEDVCEDVSPTTYDFAKEDFDSLGSFNLEVQARGFGETTAGIFQDDFIIIINVYHECRQYPQEPPCDE